MGEPVPGDIVDNIFTSVQQVFITATGVNKGDLLYRKTAGTNQYSIVDAALTAGLLQASDVVQSRVTVTSTEAASNPPIEVLSAPSYIYVKTGGIITPGALVTVNASAEVIQTATVNTSIGRMSRKSTDSAGNNLAADEDTIIVKLGVN